MTAPATPSNAGSPNVGEGVLLPCPFCGGTDVRRSNRFQWPRTGCDECGAEVEGEDRVTSDRRWNTRATSPTVPAIPVDREDEAIIAACERIDRWMDDQHTVLAPGQVGVELAYDDVTTVCRAARAASCQPASAGDAEARERDGVLEALETALHQYSEPMSLLNSHELGERLASDIQEIVRHARARNARRGHGENQ